MVKHFQEKIPKAWEAGFGSDMTLDYLIFAKSFPYPLGRKLDTNIDWCTRNNKNNDNEH